MAQDVQLTPAQHDYGTAKDYVQSAYVLMANELRVNHHSDLTFYLSFHQICGFATELYLKAFLRDKGHSEQDLKGKNGHNLAHLLALVEEYGFKDAGATHLVTVFGQHHASYEYRYLRKDSKFQPTDIGAVFEAFSSLDIAVDGAVGASKAFGGEPSGAWLFPTALSTWRR